MSEGRVVVVGGGEGGACAALSLRRHGWSGEVIVIGEEIKAAYERPPLSKTVLTDDADPTPAFVATVADFGDLDISVLRGVRVVSIDRISHRLGTMANGTIVYDHLILATGGGARKLVCEGGEYALTLRTFEDALCLRRKLRECSRLVVVGAGFIGLEVAASARTLGVTVTVVEAAARVLGRAVPKSLGENLAERHVLEGVDLRVGQRLKGISRKDDAYLVELSDGNAIAADLVVAGVGSAPRTELAASAGLDIENGIAVSDLLRTNDADIYALGDCCSFPHPLFGGKRLRLESWRNARDQAEFVALSLTGKAKQFAAVPWFWSDQYDRNLQIVGLPSEGSHTVRRDLGGDSVLDFHLADDGRLVGASALGSIDRIGRDARIAEKMIASRASPDPEHLADPGFKLKAML